MSMKLPWIYNRVTVRIMRNLLRKHVGTAQSKSPKMKVYPKAI